jgi:hypothetical protein
VSSSVTWREDEGDVTAAIRQLPGPLASQLHLHRLSVWNHLVNMQDALGLEVLGPLGVIADIIPGPPGGRLERREREDWSSRQMMRDKSKT